MRRKMNAEHVAPVKKQLDALFAAVQETFGLFFTIGTVLESNHVFVVSSGGKSVGLRTHADLKAYHELAKKLKLADKELAATVSTDYFADRLLELVILWMDGKLAQRDLENIFETASKLAVEKWMVYRPVHEGILLEGSFSIGPFRFLEWDEAAIKKKFPHVTKSGRTLLPSNPQMAIAVEVEAREPHRALEIADEMLRPADDLLRFIQDISRDMAPATIFAHEPAGQMEALMVSQTREDRNVQHKRHAWGVPISVELLTDPQDGSDWLWTIIAKTGRSEMETNVLNALRWGSQAQFESDPARAIVLYTFAIESLLQHSEGFITPSITALLSEMLAFLLVGDETAPAERAKARKQVEEEFRGIYKQRSGFAHGGGKDATWDDVERPHEILRVLIKRIAKDPELRNRPNARSLGEWVREKKFSA